MHINWLVKAVYSQPYNLTWAALSAQPLLTFTHSSKNTLASISRSSSMRGEILLFVPEPK